MTDDTASDKKVVTTTTEASPATSIDPKPASMDQPLEKESFPQYKVKSNGDIGLYATIKNTEHLLEQYGIGVRYNVVKKKLEIAIPGLSGTTENYQNTAINTLCSLATLNDITPGPIPSYVSVIADQRQFNPVANWIGLKPWDKTNRLPEVYDTLICEGDFPPQLKKTLMYRWLLSAVAAALKPAGFSARGVLTLQGPQGIGKTSWFRSLVTDLMLRDEAILLGHHLDPSTKDSVVTAISHWIVEIGELDSSFKKDIARLKGFITGTSDKVRRPYARADSEYQRRTVFCASVNEVNFLVDTTGNSRWWTIPVIRVNFDHNIDMQQVFAQLAEDFHRGEQWWLTPEEEAMLNEHNRNHQAVSSLIEKLTMHFDLDLERAEWVNKSATEVLNDVGYEKPTNPQCRECGGFLREKFGEPKKIQGVYKWRVPVKKGRFFQ